MNDLRKLPQASDLKHQIHYIYDMHKLNRWEWGETMMGHSSSVVTLRNKYIYITLDGVKAALYMPFWHAYLLFVKNKLRIPLE